jgi:DnaJ-class molecular chaperone
MSAETPPDAAPDRECAACRATGEVVSNLGGTASKVRCPWCDGTGRFIAEHDAQARWTGADAPSPPSGA